MGGGLLQEKYSLLDNKGLIGESGRLFRTVCGKAQQEAESERVMALHTRCLHSKVALIFFSPLLTPQHRLRAAVIEHCFLRYWS